MTVNQRSHEQRLESYRSFFQQDAENFNLFCDLFDLEIQNANRLEAEILINVNNEKWGDEPAFIFRKASLYIATGEFEDAVTIYTDLLSKNIDNAAIRYNLGLSYLMLQNHELAQVNFENVLASDDEIPDVYLQYAISLHYTGDIEKAIEYATRYIEVNDQSSIAYGHLALLYLDDEQRDRAENNAKRSLSLDVENREALVTLGSLSLEALSISEAINYFDQTIAKHPESGRAWSGLGLCHMMKKNLSQAENSLSKSVLFMPGHIGTWHALAWCQLVQNKITDAKCSFDSAMDIDRNFGETHGGLAVIDVLNNEKDSALRKIKVALRLDPESFSARFAESLIIGAYDKKKATQMIEDIFNTDINLNGKKLRDIVSNEFLKHSKVNK